jgi:hypothetical protein
MGEPDPVSVSGWPTHATHGQCPHASGLGPPLHLHDRARIAASPGKARRRTGAFRACWSVEIILAAESERPATTVTFQNRAEPISTLKTDLRDLIIGFLWALRKRRWKIWNSLCDSKPQNPCVTEKSSLQPIKKIPCWRSREFSEKANI